MGKEDRTDPRGSVKALAGKYSWRVISRAQSNAVAWVVIACCVVGFMALQALREEEPAAPESSSTVRVSARDEMVGRFVIFMQQFGGSAGALVGQQIEPLSRESTGTASNLCAAILLARVGATSPQPAEEGGDLSRAVEQARALVARLRENQDGSTAGALAVAEASERVIALLATRAAATPSPDAGTATADVSAEDAETIRASLGWYGQLLLSTWSRSDAFEAGLAKGALVLGVALGMFGCVVLVAGLGGVIWLGVVAFRALTRSLAQPLPARTMSGAALPWTFAAWLVGTTLLSIVGAVILGTTGRLSGTPALVLQMLIMLLPLTACLVPVLAGVPWSVARREMGLHAGAGWLREVGYGFVAYATAIPMLVVGGVLAYVLALLMPAKLEQASHPIQKELFEGGMEERVMLFIIAAVLAPVVEEIVFRGVLFTHLRELSLRWGRWIAFGLSALASSLIFAAIHPQGVVFIPVLGALAVAFCLAREMRGSLLSCMVAHGINNALVVGLNVAMSA